MRKIIFISSLIFSTLIFAQNSEPVSSFEKEYNDIMNYVPGNIISDSIYQPENRFLKTELNTIGSLKIYHNLKEELKLTKNDKKWLEERINHIATALFLDGKRILISAVSGYSGCPDKMIGSVKLNNINIIDLKFCHTCMDGYRDRKFIEIFNNQMYLLMDIEPPTFKTDSFYGEFNGIGRANSGMKLILTQDREFKFWIRKGHSSEFTQGLWRNKNDTLILNSKTLNKTDSLSYALSSAKWIEFNDLEFRLKKEKLTELKNKKRKLKKTVE